MLMPGTIKDAELTPGATVKESLTVRVGLLRLRTTEKSSVVQMASGDDVFGFYGGHRPGFQPSGRRPFRIPGARPQAGMTLGLWPAQSSFDARKAEARADSPKRTGILPVHLLAPTARLDTSPGERPGESKPRHIRRAEGPT
jgi:hypothetical protein